MKRPPLTENSLSPKLTALDTGPSPAGKPLLACLANVAFALIDTAISPLASESIPVLSAVGRRLARPAIAVSSVPGFRRAAMDGYAVRFTDTRPTDAGGVVSLVVAGESLPGCPYRGTIGSGECAAIATGAVVPEGADTVVPWEVIDRREDRILIKQPVEARKNVALSDEDIPTGSVIVAPPRTLRPQDVAACCSAGIGELCVVRRPRVGILATGDELVPPGSVLRSGQIVDTNSIVLQHLIERDGGEVVVPSAEGSAILPDDFATIRSAMAASVERVDCLLMSGGTSHGEGDHAVAALRELGNVLVRGVKIRPGGPIAFGTIRDTPVVLLPGNPVACRFGYDLFARRIIRILAARNTEWPYPRRTMRLSRSVRSAMGRLDCVRVRVVDETTVEPVWPRGASNLTSTVAADGFVLVPENIGALEAGEAVDVHFYDAED